MESDLRVARPQTPARAAVIVCRECVGRLLLLRALAENRASRHLATLDAREACPIVTPIAEAIEG